MEALHHRPFRPPIYKNEGRAPKPSTSRIFFIIEEKPVKKAGEKRKNLRRIEERPGGYEAERKRGD